MQWQGWNHQLHKKGDPLGDVQEIEIWPYKQMIYVQPSTCFRKSHIKSYGTLTYTRIT